MKSKLDVSALFHCAMMNETFINAFRITINLKEDVDEKILQQVVNQLTSKYPTICCRISKDYFWYYTDSLETIKVEKDNQIFKSINNYSIYEQAIAILYKNKSISIELFHGVSDGHGTFIYIHDLLTQYIYKKYNLENGNDIHIDYEIKDSFLETPTKEYKKQESIQINRPFQFDYRKPNANIKITTLEMNAYEIKEFASKHSCTINELLLSLIYRSILKKEHNKNIYISIPINLRKIFKSNTIKNFTLLSSLYMNNQNDISIDNLIIEIKKQMNQQNNREYLGCAISKIKQLYSIICYFPLPLKNLLIRIGSYFVGNKTCMTVSNVGKISFKDHAINQYIDSIDAILCPREKTPYNCGISTINDIMHINITHDENNEDFVNDFINELNEYHIKYNQYDYQERLNDC